MTVEDLKKSLQTLSLPDDFPDIRTPFRLLRALEEHAKQTPGDPACWHACRLAYDYIHCAEGLPNIIGTVRREHLVRWTDWSVSFDGSDIHTGEEVRIRTLRAHVRTQAFFRRQLLREMEAMRHNGLTQDVYFSDGEWPAVVDLLNGPPLEDSPAPSTQRERSIWSVRLLGTALKALVDWEHSPLHLPALAHRELRLTASGLTVQCLTPVVQFHPNLASISTAIFDMYGDDVSVHIEPLLLGILDFPDSSAIDISDRLVDGLSDALAELRHDLVQKKQFNSRDARLERLRHWVRRLVNSQRPPIGRGALGVNLDGQTTIVSHQNGTLSWGAAQDRPATIWSQQSGLAVREARRVLRSFAVAPYNARLNRQIGGDPDYVDHVCRWLNGALELRTIALILEKQT